MAIRIRDRRVYWGVMALALILAAALGHHVIYGENGYLTYRSEQRRYLELKQQTGKIKDQNDQIQREIDGLNRRDPAVIEEKAHEQQLAKPREKIYVYTPSDSKTAPATQPNNPAPKPDGQR